MVKCPIQEGSRKSKQISFSLSFKELPLNHVRQGNWRLEISISANSEGIPTELNKR